MQVRWYAFWANWGLVARLMAAVGFAVVTGGVLQSALLVVEGASESNERLERDLKELLAYLAPAVADQALVGDYAAIEQILKNQVTRSEMDSLWWSDAAGRTLKASDRTEVREAPRWFAAAVDIKVPDFSADVVAGGVGYGKVYGKMWPVGGENRLWRQFVKHLQIVVATLLLMLQFIWLIFRENLSTLHHLANGANRFSQGDYAVRIEAEGAPEVRLAADAFNDMAKNTQTLLTSLSESESKNRLLASIVEQSSEAIWTVNLDGVVTSWNAGAAAMFGYAANDVVNRAMDIGKDDPDVEAQRAQRLNSLERFSYETHATTKAGSTIDIQVAVAPLLGEDSGCIGKISVARDVTERNRSDDALRAARVAAESANVAKSAFLARMSHEIRTPMNGVLGMTELMLDTELTPVQRKYAETVQRSGANLLNIINDILDFSKIEAGKLELEMVNFDLRDTIEDVVDMLAERASSKGLELACVLPSKVSLRVTGDSLRLGQVLTNLVGNAIKFTLRGSVLISVSVLDDEPDQVKMRFDVKDTGPGISAEAQGRIFEEFSQADGSTTRQFGGSGLGLAISKQLVEMMNGNIHVDSMPGAGATFWFSAIFKKQPLPVAAENTATATAGGSALAGLRTLIVELNTLGHGILQEQVGGWGMTTLAAGSSTQALSLLRHAATQGAPFDLAILDMGLSGADALKLATAIKAEPAITSTKIAALTPLGNHALVQELRDAGVDACLVKPVRQSSLYDMLVDVISGQASLELQAEDAMSVTNHMNKKIAEGGVLNRGAILLVEDNVVNQMVSLGLLNKLTGYSVELATNGREAVEACSKGHYDLILMDCHMPEMDGFQATREIRAREAAAGKTRIPIVALTANAMAQDREECLSAGMDGHLGKPFNSKQLQDTLNLWMPAKAAVVAPQTKRS